MLLFGISDWTQSDSFGTWSFLHNFGWILIFERLFLDRMGLSSSVLERVEREDRHHGEEESNLIMSRQRNPESGSGEEEEEEEEEDEEEEQSEDWRRNRGRSSGVRQRSNALQYIVATLMNK